MKKIIFYLSLLLVLALPACKKEEAEVFPEVETVELLSFAPDRVTAKGSIRHTGTRPVLDHGFLYGKTPILTLDASQKISLGTGAKQGEMVALIENLLPENYHLGKTIYARAYLTNENGTVYGEVKSVELPSPKIKSISPLIGKANDPVAIHGEFFTTNKDLILVVFNDTRATILEATPNRLLVLVPAGIENHSGQATTQVTVRIGAITHLVTSAFKINHSISGFSPEQGYVGTQITIQGENFPAINHIPSDIKVFIEGKPVGVNAYEKSQLRVAVPGTITSGKVKIVVSVKGQTFNLPGEFTVLPPVISAISPTQGMAGSTFTVQGTGLLEGYAFSGQVVMVGGLEVKTFTVLKEGELTVTVPLEAAIGDNKIVFKHGPYSIDIPQSFKVLPPIVNSFTPDKGGHEQKISIYGQFLKGNYYQVYIGATAISDFAETDTELTLTLPHGLPAGKTKLIVKYGQSTLEADGEFTVLAPAITALLPASGKAGTKVTLHCEGFIPNENTQVRFGTVAATITRFTDKTLEVVVPLYASPGNNLINVTYRVPEFSSFRTITSTSPFTVIE